MPTQSEALIWNSNVECLPRSQIEALQLQRLKQVLEYVYQKVPFYRQRFDELGCKSTSLKSLSDLKQFPFTQKKDLRDHYPFGLLAVPVNKLTRLHCSSGTKGKPTVVGYTQEDIAIWAEVCARSLACAGARPGDVIHNSYGYGLFTGGLGLHYGAEKFGATVVPASGGRTQQQILLLQDFSARVICSTPSYALNIAYTMEELGIKLDSIKLEIGILGAEPWTEGMRRQIEQRLQITALDIYGLTEVIGPGVSMECREGKGSLHIWEDHFLPEVVDPKSGEVLKDEEEGELVLTTLTKQGLPVIRYRTGDISWLSRERCACGRTMVRMNRVKARLDDMLIIRGVNVFPTEIEKTLLNVEELSPHYQLVLAREKALDTLEVQIEVTEALIKLFGTFEHGSVELSKLTGIVQNLLKDSLGLTAEVKLLQPGSLGRSEGKAVRVIDQRSNNS